MPAGGLVRGSITVDGHPKVHETFRRVASYVEQVRRRFQALNPHQLRTLSQSHKRMAHGNSTCSLRHQTTALPVILRPCLPHPLPS